MPDTAPSSAGKPGQFSIAAVVTICAQQKRVNVGAGATPAALDKQPQHELEAAWQRIVSVLPAETRVGDLYAGRAFGLAKAAAKQAQCPLYVLSAGLGLVPANVMAPAYGLTVSKNTPESIADRSQGEFNPAAWFASLMAGEFSVAWDAVGIGGRGRILIAMTKPYAELAGASLAAAGPRVLQRVRIFGENLSRALPQRLHETIVPYDQRLDALVPGTRSDFAQRALLHFVDHIADAPQSQEAEAAAIRVHLESVTAPSKPARAQRTDAELLALIRERVGPKSSASALLRQLRDADGIACEQGRFARLFRSVTRVPEAT